MQSPSLRRNVYTPRTVITARPPLAPTTLQQQKGVQSDAQAMDEYLRGALGGPSAEQTLTETFPEFSQTYLTGATPGGVLSPIIPKTPNMGPISTVKPYTEHPALTPMRSEFQQQQQHQHHQSRLDCGDVSRVVGGDERWVTVFGFPEEYQDAVLRHFRDLGNIVQTQKGAKNWIGIKFHTEGEAELAVEKNAKLLPNEQIMIGVVRGRRYLAEDKGGESEPDERRTVREDSLIKSTGTDTTKTNNASMSSLQTFFSELFRLSDATQPTVY